MQNVSLYFFLILFCFVFFSFYVFHVRLWLVIFMPFSICSPFFSEEMPFCYLITWKCIHQIQVWSEFWIIMITEIDLPSFLAGNTFVPNIHNHNSGLSERTRVCVCEFTIVLGVRHIEHNTKRKWYDILLPVLARILCSGASSYNQLWHVLIDIEIVYSKRANQRNSTQYMRLNRLIDNDCTVHHWNWCIAIAIFAEKSIVLPCQWKIGKTYR